MKLIYNRLTALILQIDQQHFHSKETINPIKVSETPNNSEFQHTVALAMLRNSIHLTNYMVPKHIYGTIKNS
jgi:hypothetical protein